MVRNKSIHSHCAPIFRVSLPQWSMLFWIAAVAYSSWQFVIRGLPDAERDRRSGLSIMLETTDGNMLKEDISRASSFEVPGLTANEAAETSRPLWLGSKWTDIGRAEQASPGDAGRRRRARKQPAAQPPTRRVSPEPDWPSEDVDELEEEDEDEDEGEGDEGGGEEASVRGRSPETPTLAVTPGKVRRNGKKRATSWRAALKGTALGGVDEVAEVEDPLTMPFVDAAGLAKNLLGKAFEYSRDRLFVTSENHRVLHAKDPVRDLRNLPLHDPIDGPQPPCTSTAAACRKTRQHRLLASCAVVGNAGAAKAARFGASIDRHAAVIRINQGPTAGYEKFVGSRTTFRLLGRKWVALYTSKDDGRAILLPAEVSNSTLLVSRVSASEYEHLASLVRRVRPDVKVAYLAQGVATRARWLLAAFREGAGQLGVDYLGGDAPSSGFIALYFALQVCDRIAVYGLSMESSRLGEPSTYAYHYFSHYVDSVQLRAHPHHSFQAEGDLINALEDAGRVTICGGSRPNGDVVSSRNSPQCSASSH
mmetsp:Transcript_832/g.1750  ORF Transcript_832/g.1750 Transcript_832/m.1750 type:complete len:535 (-) Transcript_832:314-1918(-)